MTTEELISHLSREREDMSRERETEALLGALERERQTLQTEGE